MKFKGDNGHREQLLTIFSQAIQAVNGYSCVLQYLRSHSAVPCRTNVVALGKAAQSMLAGAVDYYQEYIVKGLLVTKQGYIHNPGNLPPAIQIVEAAHPHPDQSSLDAGKALLEFISSVPESENILFLISGGTSALVEVLSENVSLEDLKDLSNWLLARGWPIDEMNRIRKSVSCIKAGRLASVIKANNVLQLLISDVPGDDLSAIGSGLLIANPDDQKRPEELPKWLVKMQALAPRLPAADDPCFRNIESHVIANNETARKAVVKMAAELGFTVQCNEVMQGDIVELGECIAKKLLKGNEGIYIWGGEATIKLPEQPGKGGRAQALALIVASRIQAVTGITLLAAGTDGTDGSGDAAGALVDGQAVNRGIDAGYDLQDAIENADAGSFLAGSGDLIDTGPTGTNVMDLVIALKKPLINP